MSDTDDIAETLARSEAKSKWRKRVFWAAGAAAAVIVVVLFLSRSADDEALAYVTEPVTRGTLIVEVTATGTVEPTNLVEISSELSGTMAEVLVDFNDEVVEGTVLAKLDTTKLEAQVEVARASLAAAEARVQMAQASLSDARQKYEAARSLDQLGVTSHQSFVSLQSAFRRAEAELVSVQAERDLAEARLELDEAELDRACICSPIDGVVLDRAVDPGQIVASSLAAPILFTVAEDLRKMELQVDVDEADIGRIGLGNSAEFTVDAYDDRRFPAIISELRYAPETVDGVVTYKAILSIDNSDLLLRPGMTATADIVVARIEDALLVPNAALRFAPPETGTVSVQDERSGLLGMLIPSRTDAGSQLNNRSLWVLRDGAGLEVEILAGQTDGTFTQILEGDLSEGDRVITDLTDG